jgi:tRNA (guanine26-N2/guanine27-N2)-dimethyltransferase
MKVTEENITIQSYGETISKDLDVFYNPVMKTNRDISLLVFKAYFSKQQPIHFCDPMIATGIRELRFLKEIPEIFQSLTLGDVSPSAIQDAQKNFQNNNISTEKCTFIAQNALTTLSKQYYHAIEIDPFGSPIPFIDIALQRIKHNGLLSITATDTASLCGTYPKKTQRRYNKTVEKTFCYDEIGLRILLATIIENAARYDKYVNVVLAYSKDHYYKVFLQICDGAQKALEQLQKLNYICWDKISQEIQTSPYEQEGYFGKVYTGPLKQQELIETMVSILPKYIKEKKETLEKFLTKIKEEIDTLGYINIHKLARFNQTHCEMSFEELITQIKEKGYDASRVHNNGFGLKTTMPIKKLLEILKK